MSDTNRPVDQTEGWLPERLVAKWAAMGPFEKARWKLTGWYVLIWSVLIIGFTYLTFDAKQSAYIRVYRVVDAADPGGQQVQEFADTFATFNRRFRERVIIFDLFLFGAGAWVAYWLSGKTLQPIETMVEEQNAFAADVSHGLRTPLTTIQLEIEAYRRGQARLPRGLGQTLVSVQEEVASMTYMVEGLLALVRGGNDPLRSQMKHVQVAAVTRDAYERMRPIARAKKQRLQLGVVETATVWGNREQLFQVVSILIDNAIKYSGANSLITVAVKRQLSLVKIEVKDTGKGIPKGAQERIFERYYRGGEQVRGAGLGLSIARKLVQAHEGTITVKSAVGKGTTFTVVLPKGKSEKKQTVK